MCMELYICLVHEQIFHKAPWEKTWYFISYSIICIKIPSPTSHDVQNILDKGKISDEIANEGSKM